jgi:hypothetical protein
LRPNVLGLIAARLKTLARRDLWQGRKALASLSYIIARTLFGLQICVRCSVKIDIETNLLAPVCEQLFRARGWRRPERELR